MLVIVRYLNGVIKINDDIKIMIVKIDESQVSIGIKAPREVEILRTELIKKKD
jgi:carbon storage regulator